MCEHKMKHWVANAMPVTVTYEVLELEKETDDFWEVWLKPVRQFFNGKESEVDKPRILYCFAKRKEVGRDKELDEPIYEYLPEPSFIKHIKPAIAFDDVPKLPSMQKKKEEAQGEVPF